MTIYIKIYSFHYLYITKFINNIKYLEKTLNKNFFKISFNNILIKNEKITILKSPHVNKSARDQFEKKTYIKKIKIIWKNYETNQFFHLKKLISLIKNLAINVKLNIKIIKI